MCRLVPPRSDPAATTTGSSIYCIVERPRGGGQQIAGRIGNPRAVRRPPSRSRGARVEPPPTPHRRHDPSGEASDRSRDSTLLAVFEETNRSRITHSFSLIFSPITDNSVSEGHSQSSRSPPAKDSLLLPPWRGMVVPS